MPLTNAGRNFIAEALINDDSPIFFNNTNAYIGVGDSDALATAENIATQTNLQAAENKDRKGMEDNYPSRTDNAITFKASFATEDSDFTWKEWGVFNHASAGVMLNRKVESLGTKDGGTWVLTVTVTVGIGS